MRVSVVLFQILAAAVMASLAFAWHPAHAAIIGDKYWAPADSQAPDVKLPTLNSILSANMKFHPKGEKPAVSIVRKEAIQAEAAAYGAQAGLALALLEINGVLKKNAAAYDKIYDFNAVLLEPGFLPPVISEGVEPYRQSSDSVVRAADLIYKIEFDARIVNTAPRWQDYLSFQVSQPEPPDASLLPQNGEENVIWDEWVKKGWKEGTEQAQTIFSSNLARLNRDYLGMWRFKRLYSQGMVSKPILARSSLGVTGGGREMAVNDRIVKITEGSKLNPNSSHWLYTNPK